jgi:hypothetical protein
MCVCRKQARLPTNAFASSLPNMATNQPTLHLASGAMLHAQSFKTGPTENYVWHKDQQNDSKYQTFDIIM